MSSQGRGSASARAAGQGAAAIEARAASWLARRDGAEWGAADEELLAAWIAESTAHRVAYLRLAQAWTRADRLAALRSARGAWHGAAPQWRLNRGAWGASARRTVLGLALFGAAGVLTLGLSGPWRGNHYTTDTGGRELVSLADGTRLMLNTDSRARAVVADGKRTVWLERGEAYFDVAHDRARPFVVMAGSQRVTVLGTRFSVRMQEGRVSVLVEEGRVQVDTLAADARVSTSRVVTRDDAVVAEAGSLDVTHRTPAQVASALSWREGRIVLDDLTLGEAAAEFNRYNRVKLVIADTAVAQMRIGGTFEVANVERFAHLLQTGFGLSMRENTEQILISR